MTYDPFDHDDDPFPEPEGSEDAEQAGEDRPEGAAEGGRVPVALAATDQPVQLHVGLIEDERTPEGMVCMGTYCGERLIARCVLPPEAYQELEEQEIFEDPVPVVLVAQEAPPGLQCRLFAMIALPEGMEEEDEEDAEEPWAASVPSSAYEAAVADAEAEAAVDDLDAFDGDEEDEDDEDDPRIVPLPLGNIVRYERDRVHPESLAREAMDVLQKVIEGRTSEVVDRALADLLGL
ncbi:MAG TPA: hypothetical protein VFS40_09685 [Gemmatimonadales bacterium]|nr:hypothetical protein [Gemmatimonadales bacterium]